MILNSPYITGSITVTGNANVQGTLTVTGSLSGTATSASLALNSNLLQGTGSVGFSTTASLLEVSSSQQQISASLLNVIANYATTGSNSFRANQSITGSLVVSSTITAQTLVVQTVTSSIVYSSGSNIFGSALTDRQTFTGSVNITGSIALAGRLLIGATDDLTNALQVKGDGVFANRTNSVVTSTSILSISTGGTYGTTAAPKYLDLVFSGDNKQIAKIRSVDETGNTDGGYLMFYTSMAAGSVNQNMILHRNGNVNIGTSFTTDSGYKLDVSGSGRFIGAITATQFNVSTSGGTTQIYNTGGGHTVITNATANKDLNIQTSGTGAQYFNTAGVDRLIIASTGAATFSSTISAGVITGDGGSTGTPGIIAKNPSGGGNNGTFGFGNSSDYRIRGGSDYTAIIFDTAGSERMRIKNTQIIIGSTSNNAEGRLNVSGDSAGNSNNVRLEFSTAQTYGYFQCADRVNVASKRLYIDSADLYINYLGTGTVYSNGSVLTNTNPSDSRLKENITDIAFGLNEILQLRPVEYNWINDKSNQGKQYGFVAQEVQSIIPSLVKEFTIPESELEGTEEMIRLGLEKDGIYVGLVKAIQELKATNDDLQAQINELKER